MLEAIGTIFVTIGLVFDVFGCIGIVRLPDVYLRLQAGTKCITLGTCSILFGTFLIVGPSDGGVKAILCMLFIVLTNPVAAHAIVRSAHRSGIKPCERTIADQYAQDRKEGKTA